MTRPRRQSRLLRSVASPEGSVYVGVTLIVTGLALIALGWGRMADLHDVALQLPYFASACFTGVSVIVCGVALVLIGTRARDGQLEREQLMALTATWKDVGALLEGRVDAQLIEAVNA